MGGDEKIIRVLDAPLVVIDGLRELCDIAPFDTQSSREGKIVKAYIPELGLSNKAADLMSKQEQEEQQSRGVVAIDWNSAPLEGQLADHTLWPEVKKLFGHFNEIMCMDLSSDGTLLASASKARNAKAANVLVWDVRRYVCVAELSGQESTVVRVKFSCDSKYVCLCISW